MPALRRMLAAFIGSLLLAAPVVADDAKKPELTKTSEMIKDDLNRLALAMHKYESAYYRLPPAATVNQFNKPLLSWRVLMLPYLGEEKLYKEFHLDEPWDSNHNKKLIAKTPAIFRAPNKKLADEFKTVYLAPVSKETVFQPDGATVKLSNIYDGTYNTILLVQANDGAAVTWTKPDDLPVDTSKPFRGLEQPGEGFFFVAMCDGTVHRITSKGDPLNLAYTFTHAGGEVTILSALTKPMQPIDGVIRSLQYVGNGIYGYQNDAFKRLAPAVIRGQRGEPLLSWRVAVLPYILQRSLYEEFHLDEPWDSDHNKKLIPRMPIVYQGLNPKLNAAGKTRFLVPVAPSTMFPPDGRKIVLDRKAAGNSGRIMAVEVNEDSAVIWTKPDDLNFDMNKPMDRLVQPGQDFFRALMADGKVRQFRLTIEPAKLASMFNFADGKPVEIKPEDEVPLDRPGDKK
jgi:hypothetical protein